MTSGLPMIDDDSAPFWDAARQGRLVLQQCNSCDEFQHYPRSLCIACRGDDLEFVDASGKGVIHSFTIVHRSPNPEQFTAPYVVALIRLEEGPIMMSNVVGADLDDIACEQPVSVDWRTLDDGNRLPIFVPGEGS